MGNIEEQLAYMKEKCTPIDHTIINRCITEFACEMNAHGKISGCASCGSDITLAAGRTQFAAKPLRHLKHLEVRQPLLDRYLATPQQYQCAFNIVGFNSDFTCKLNVPNASVFYHLHNKFVVPCTSASLFLTDVMIVDNEYVAILCEHCLLATNYFGSGYDFGLPFKSGLGLAPLSKCAKLLISRYRCSQQVVKLSVLKTGMETGYASRGHAIGIAHEGRKTLNADCLLHFDLPEDKFSCFLIGTAFFCSVLSLIS